MESGRLFLPKSHILRSKTDIDALLEQGSVLFKYPLKIYYRPRTGEGEEGDSGSGSAAFSRMMVSVPKRGFKRAIHRNLLKRRIREAWRLNAAMLGERRFDLLFVYLGREIESYERIQTSLTNLLRQLGE